MDRINLLWQVHAKCQSCCWSFLVKGVKLSWSFLEVWIKNLGELSYSDGYRIKGWHLKRLCWNVARKVAKCINYSGMGSLSFETWVNYVKRQSAIYRKRDPFVPWKVSLQTEQTSWKRYIYFQPKQIDFKN